MYILLTNNEEELRIVKGDTVSRLQPMFDLGFYPEGSLEYGDIPIEDSLALIESLVPLSIISIGHNKEEREERGCYV
jgi:hypothetical protein